MKKLGKLNINPEKVMKNEELISLKGGYYSCCMCSYNMHYMGIMAAWGQEDCKESCGLMGWDGDWGNCSFPS